MTKSVHVRITGRVQGVGFREWTKGEATALGLTGWVRNETDGSVSALVTGPESSVDAMLERFWKGPSWSSVSDVTSESAPTDAPVPATFTVMRR